MTHVTCRLTAKNRDQLRNPTLGNRVWATSTFFIRVSKTRDSHKIYSCNHSESKQRSHCELDFFIFACKYLVVFYEGLKWIAIQRASYIYFFLKCGNETLNRRLVPSISNKSHKAVVGCLSVCHVFLTFMRLRLCLLINLQCVRSRANILVVNLP